MPTHLKNRKLQRQIFAYESIKELGNLADKKKYKNYCENIALMVYTNSLVSAAAYLKSKDSVSKKLYDHIKIWLQKEEIDLIPSDKDLLSHLMSSQMNSAKLLHCTKEVMILANHLKEMAKALIISK